MGDYYDNKSLVSAATNSVASGHFEYALQTLAQVDSSGHNHKYISAFVSAHLGLHESNFPTSCNKSHLEAARNAAESGAARAKPGRIAVEQTMLFCRTLEMSGDFLGATQRYNELLLDYPMSKQLLTIRFRAAAAFKRCDLIEESLANLQQVLDDPISPYDEVDIMLLLGLGYEFSNAKGSKRMAKEAYKEAYKKARESGSERVKYQPLETGTEELYVDRGFDPPDGYPQFAAPPTSQTARKHVSFSEWKEDPGTWLEFSRRARANGDLIFALDLMTKTLWTPAGQENIALWTEFAGLSFLLGDQEAAVQAIATVFYKEPCEFSVRRTLALWDPENWGKHIAFEEATITKVQAMYRGIVGRRFAAQHKVKVLIERKRRYEAAVQIQRRIVRGPQGRAKAQRRREQIAAEWAAYQRFLFETASATTIECLVRQWLSRRHLDRLRLERDASSTIQRSFRCYLARMELGHLKAEWLFKRQTFGALSMQRLFQGFQGRKIARAKYIKFNGARGFQNAWRAYVARAAFAINIANFRGAQQMQRIVRGYQRRMWYKGILGKSAAKIQTIYRAYVCRTAFPGFARAMAKRRSQYALSSTRFFRHLESFGANFEASEQQTWRENHHAKSQQHEDVVEEHVESKDSDKNLDSPKVKSARGKPSSLHEKGSDQPLQLVPLSRPQTAPALSQPALVEKNNKKKVGVIDAVFSPQVMLCKNTSDGNRGAGKITSWLAKYPREAQVIWLTNWSLGAEETKRLAKTLESNESIKELGLGAGSDIDYGGCHALAEALRCHNFRFTRLFVNDQPSLGEQGVLPLMKTIGDFFFGRYSRLEEVSLRNTRMGDRCCLALAEGLALNTKLKSLQLEHNCIGDKGAIALAEAFERNQALLELDLSCNHVGSLGAAALACELFKTVTTNGLEILRLDENFVGNHGGVSIRKYLSKCRKVDRPMCITTAANPMQVEVLNAVRVLSTALPRFASRSAESSSAVEVQLSLHQRKLAQNRLGQQHQQEMEVNDAKAEEKSIGTIFNRLKKPQRVSSPSPNGTLPPVRVTSPGAKPKQLHWSRRGTSPTSPYLSPPWSPRITSK